MIILNALALVCLIGFPVLFVANYLQAGILIAILGIVFACFGVGSNRWKAIVAALAEVGVWFFMSIGLT